MAHRTIRAVSPIDGEMARTSWQANVRNCTKPGSLSALLSRRAGQSSACERQRQARDSQTLLAPGRSWPGTSDLPFRHRPLRRSVRWQGRSARGDHRGDQRGQAPVQAASIHGNPWLRLLRREVEELVRTRRGERYLRERQARTELARINRELKQLRTELVALEERRAALLSDLGEQGSPR